jgi:predicted DNA-binding protein with PD1-like motif
MEYTQGRTGRVFVARLEDGESIYDVVEEIAHKESIEAASVLAIGGIRKGKVVTGPQHPTGTVVPHYEEFDDARELVGVGTVFLQEGKPSLHFHAGIGRRDSALVGCPRAGMSVYLVLEVIITELVDVSAERAYDPESGANLLKVG